MGNNIIVLSKRDTCPEGYILIDTTSKNPNTELKRGLSPFYLGPVKCYDDLESQNMENVWQYSKVYKGHINPEGNPNDEYFNWRNSGFAKNFADRYPMGKGKVPEYSYWKIDDEYQKLNYIQSRKKVYIPLYAKVVVNTKAYQYLEELKNSGTKIALVDFDGYNHEKLGMSLKKVINCKTRKMGHAFVLAMLLQDKLAVRDNKLIDMEGILK